jgi:small-conductance mechanosensitive channel
MPIRLVYSILCFALLAITVRAQDSLLLDPEKVIHETMEIDLAKISMESTEIIFSLTKEMRQVISDEELEELQTVSEELVLEIDSLLEYRKDEYLEMKNIRSLRNHLNFWKQKYLELDAVDSRILSLNKEFDKNRLRHARELAAWNDIREIAVVYHYDKAVLDRVDHVVNILQAAITTYGRKSGITLGMLNDLNRVKLDVDERIDTYDRILIERQKNIFQSGRPAFFRQDFANSDNWKIIESFNLMHRGELKALGSYFRKHIYTAIFHLILLILAIIFMVYLKRSGIPEGQHEDANYRRSLKIIISNPGNSALILVLFASVLIYPNRPMLFSDIFKLVISVPLAITLSNMVSRKYRSIIIAFVVLVILQVISASLSTHLIPTRILLLLIASIEVGTLAAFIYLIRRARWHRKTLYRIVILLCSIHLAIAVLAIVTNLAGKVLLTQSLLNAVSGTALALVLIVLAMLVGNGLMMIFIDSRIAEHIRVVRKRKEFMKDSITRFFQFLAVAFMVYYIIEAYGLDVYIGDGIRAFFAKERTLGSVGFTWGQIVIFFLIIWLSVVISKLIRIFLEEEILDRMGLARGLPNTIALMVRYTLITLGFLAAASFAGLKMSNLTIILGALGVGIGFGLQNIFNNLVSGLILLLERPIKIGDTVEVGNLIGVVKHIGIRASNVHTVDGAEIIVPNGNLISSEVINWTLTDKRRRIEVLIGVAYGSDPYKARELFEGVLKSHPEVVSEPKPIILLNNFGDSSLDFRILFWTDNFDDWIRIRSDVNFKIHDALKEAGIQIPFPQRDVHIRTVDPEQGDKLK